MQPAPPLHHFVRRVQALALYRALLRAARAAPSDARAALAAEIRAEFEKAPPDADPLQHTFLLAQGRKKLAELEQMLHLSR